MLLLYSEEGRGWALCNAVYRYKVPCSCSTVLFASCVSSSLSLQHISTEIGILSHPEVKEIIFFFNFINMSQESKGYICLSVAFEDLNMWWELQSSLRFARFYLLEIWSATKNRETIFSIQNAFCCKQIHSLDVSIFAHSLCKHNCPQFT